MSAVLLTWKSSEWPPGELEDMLNRFRAGETVHRWSCGNSKNIVVGTRAFLLMQGSSRGGIFGFGEVSQEPFVAEHYNEQKRRRGETANYVMVNFHSLFDPRTEIKIRTDELRALHDTLWRAQGSGKKIPSEVEANLLQLWRQRVETSEISYPDDLETKKDLKEGAKKTVTVNAYERNPEARAKCIEHWGLNCVVCRFNFQYVYGPLGDGYIHVHHLKPLAEIGEEYEVDPVEDLRPVCPNCHAMLHKKRPAMAIEDLQGVLSLYGRRGGS